MRYLTILAIVAICAYAIQGGSDIVGVAAQRQQTDADQVDHLLEWRKTPGVAGTAIKAALQQMPFTTDRPEAQQRAEMLGWLLAVRPLSATDWLSLAGARVTADAPHDQVLSALTMSHLIGPNEDILMLQRGIFGLLQWDMLTDAVRQRVIRDLVGMINEPGNPEPVIPQIAAALRGLSPEALHQIAAMFHAAGLSDQVLDPLGLGSDDQRSPGPP